MAAKRGAILEPNSASYEAYVASLHRAFLELRDSDTGDLLVDELVPIQQLFPGDRSHALPDFSITWRPAPLARRVVSPEIGEVEAEALGARGGDHTDFGFVSVTPSAATEFRLRSFAPVEYIWDLGTLITRLDKLAANEAA